MRLNQKFFAFVLGTVFILSITSSFVSAASVRPAIDNLIQQLTDIIEPIVVFALGGVEGGVGFDSLLVKGLIFVVMMSVFYLAMERMPLVNESTGFTWTLAVILAILSTRFLTTQALLELVWLPTGVLGIALTTFLPFVIFFFFVERGIRSRLLRRIAWIFFIVIYIGLTWSRWPALQPGQGFNLGWIYVLIGILSLLCIIFDGTIRNSMLQIRMERVGANNRDEYDRELRRRMQQAHQDLANNIITPEEHTRIIADIRRRMSQLART